MGFIVFFDPLEQFELVNFDFNILNYTFSVSNITITFLGVMFILIFCLSLIDLVYLHSWFTILFIGIFNFLKNICKNNLNISVQIFIPFLFFTFLFIGLSNLIGMIPYSFTLTSHFSITFFISLSFFIGMNFFGILKNGIEFVNLFLPSSSPILISPLLLIVEIVSYFARVFSLAIRLFANMMAGHALMKILSGFCWTFFSMYTVTGLFVSSIVFLIIFCVIGLEFLIAFLQAYVFFMLMVVYLNDLVSTNH